ETSLDQVFNYLFDLLARVVSYDTVSIQLIENDRAYLAAARGSFSVEQLRHAIESIIPSTLEERWGQLHQRLMVIPDTQTDSRWITAPGSEYIRSWIGAALRVKGRLLGILNVDSATVNAYDGSVGETVAAFANQAAIAIENAQLHEAVRRHADELERRVIERTAELERERQRIQAILDAAGEGIVFTDPEGIIEYVNPAMEKLTGYAAGEVRGQNLRLWRSSRSARAIIDDAWRVIRQGELWLGEMVNRRKDGVLYEVAITIAPLNGAAGDLIGHVGILHDIAHQKEVERLKDQFVSNVSHELRTPLANVKLYLSLLERGRPEKRGEYMQTLHREAARLTNLIEDMLDISRLDLGATQIQSMPTDLNPLIDQLIIDRSALAGDRSLSIECQLDPDVPPALADPPLLAQVMSNLMTNAINYTPPGGVITISTGVRERQQRRWITFSVRDTGPGIAPQDLPHLFERFYRGEVGRKSGAPGTGLGLAICQEIIARMDGQITVESRPATEGSGATFTVWLRPVDEELP
ncbi:MAG TPA: ATP-binding protein, partial [Anaerolineae bacterium]